MAKKLTKEITDTGVSIEFANGETLALQFADLSEDIKFRLMAHGASQKLGDASAGTETVEEAIAETKKVLERLIAGGGIIDAPGEAEFEENAGKRNRLSIEHFEGFIGC